MLGDAAGFDVLAAPFHVNQGAPIVVQAGPAPWAYGLEALPDPQACFEAQLLVELKVKVTRGTVGVGILRGDGQSFYHEVELAVGDWQPITLLTPPHHDLGSFVVRNYGEDGLCEAELVVVGARPAAHDLYLIYQPGKVGSNAIDVALSQALPATARIERHHYLSDSSLNSAMKGADEIDSKDAEREEHFFGADGVWRQIKLARRARAAIEATAPGRTLLITGIRDPISYAIAALFQNLETYCPWLSYRYDRTAAETELLLDYVHGLFAQIAADAPASSDADHVARSKLKHPGWWFEAEFAEYTGIDIYDSNLQSQPFVRFQHGTFDVLLFRHEHLRRSLVSMLASVGLTARTSPEVNVGADKRYAALYAAFKRRFEITDVVRATLLDNVFTRRFYPEMIGER